MTELYVKATAAASFICDQTPLRPETAIICGTGLSNLVDSLNPGAIRLQYQEIPHFKLPTVQGHAGEIVIGTIGPEQTPVLCVNGRLHTYEGHDIKDTVFSVRVFALMGVRNLIVTNAAGYLNPEYETGDLMVISDHLNLPGLSGLHPLKGPNEDGFGVRFPPMGDAYSHELRHKLWQVSKEIHLQRALREGVYVYVSGPSFETPAECRMLRAMGGDAVGMSTVPEVIAAVHSGIHVLGVSVLTNIASTVPPAPMEHVHSSQLDFHGHEDVLEEGRRASEDLELLITKLVTLF